jgi:hypothetical protein
LALGGNPTFNWEVSPLLEYPDAEDLLPSLFRHMLGVVCFSETVSLRILELHLGAAKEKPIVEVLNRIKLDESLHAEVGWPMAAHLAQRLDIQVLERELQNALLGVEKEFEIAGNESDCPPNLRRFGSASVQEYRQGVRESITVDIPAKIRQYLPTVNPSP